MIRSTRTADGRPAFTGTGRDLEAAAVWSRALCHLVFGPVEGEARYRRIPAETVLTLWAREPEEAR